MVTGRFCDSTEQPKRYAGLRVKKQKFGETTCEVSGMDQREVLRKMAFTALGLVLAIEIVAIAGADAQPAESVYAQGEYVQTLEGAKIARLRMLCRR